MVLLSAGTASATPGPGTYGPGSWFFDPGTGLNAIQVPGPPTTATSTSTAHQAQVQQPINADGSSIFNHKSSTIPVKFKVQSQTVTTTTTTTGNAVYPGLLDSEQGATYPSVGDYGALSFTPPTGTTIGQISNLMASFAWQAGHNHAGSMRWSIVTPAGNFYVYYGDTCPFCQDGIGQSGTNMTTLGDQRVETPENGPGAFKTWNDLVTGNNGVNASDASLPVSEIDLVVDAGFAGTQQVQLSDVQITDQGVTSEYVPGSIAGGTTTSTVTGPLVTDNSAPAWISITKFNGATPIGPIDESTLTSTQGDVGGQFRQVDSMYMYNLPVNDLGDPSATYQVGVSFHSDGSSPVPSTVKFGLK
jgi:hypothetical protein